MWWLQPNQEALSASWPCSCRIWTPDAALVSNHCNVCGKEFDLRRAKVQRQQQLSCASTICNARLQMSQWQRNWKPWWRTATVPSTSSRRTEPMSSRMSNETIRSMSERDVIDSTSLRWADDSNNARKAKPSEFPKNEIHRASTSRSRVTVSSTTLLWEKWHWAAAQHLLWDHLRRSPSRCHDGSLRTSVNLTLRRVEASVRDDITLQHGIMGHRCYIDLMDECLIWSRSCLNLFWTRLVWGLSSRDVSMNARTTTPWHRTSPEWRSSPTCIRWASTEVYTLLENWNPWVQQ